MRKQEDSNYRGRWVVKNNGEPFSISHYSGLPYAVKVVKETISLGVSCLLIEGGYVVRYEEVSLANPTEIEKEKARRIEALESES